MLPKPGCSRLQRTSLGSRWRHVDLEATPLGAIHVTSQYDGRPLKTERSPGEHSRRVPVHPGLAALLTWWWAEGFELMNCRAPTPDDFVIPRRVRGQVEHLAHHTKKTGATLWGYACREAGVDNLTLHATRHTFITLARRGGARAEVVEQITHNARGTIVDHYTHWDWEPLCEAVLALQLPQWPPAKSPPEIVAENVATPSERASFPDEQWRRGELKPRTRPFFREAAAR